MVWVMVRGGSKVRVRMLSRLQPVALVRVNVLEAAGVSENKKGEVVSPVWVLGVVPSV